MNVRKITSTMMMCWMMMAYQSAYSQCIANQQVKTFNGDTEVQICLGSGLTSVYMVPQYQSSPVVYAITDEQDMILDIVHGSKIDFGGAPPGVCRVYGVSWWGTPFDPVGASVHEAVFSDYCYEISANYVEVTRILLGSGTVQTEAGHTQVYTCPGDGIADVVSFTYEGTSEASFTYLITDPDFNILGVPDGTSQDFEGAGIGVCLVWGLNYEGDLLASVGGNAKTDELASGCYGLTETPITVTRAIPEGGQILTANGEDEIDLCVGDGLSDLTEFEGHGISEAGFRLVVTDDANNIVGLPPANAVDFDDAGQGVCRVWGASYTGNFLLELGQNIEDAEISDACNDLSDGFVQVNRTEVKGGTVQTTDGATTVYTCTQDGTDDVFNFERSDAMGDHFKYVITTPDLEILGIVDNMQNFDGAPPGICWVWGLSYSGGLTAEVGDNAGEVSLSDGCSDLSDNYIVVNRDVPDGGTVSMPSGATERFTCAQDGQADVVKFTHADASNSRYIYIITSPDLEILGIASGDSMDFDGAPPGTCWVWGMAYTGSIIAEVGDTVGQVPMTDDCFDFSENVIKVIRDVPDGGSVSTHVGDTVVYTCPQDGQADLVSFSHQGASESKYAYIITSPDLEILGVTTDSEMDFDGAPPGNCLVWGLAYTGELTAQVGDNAGEISLSDDCYDLSDNYIEVIRRKPEGGTVSMPSGATERTTCTQDGSSDVVVFVPDGQSDSKYAYVITSPALEILGIELNDSHDFDDAPPGTCWVWGLAYTGVITAQVGDQADEVQLSSGCADLSDNYIEVIRTSPEGGQVATHDGDTVVYTCTQDSTADIVEMVHEGTSGASYVYIITSPELEILGIETNDNHDFNDAPPGTCWIWGMAYTGALTAEVGQHAGESALSDGCFDLSDNYITVIRDVPEGGTVEMPSGATTRYTCTEDGRADVVSFVNKGASHSKYAYIITSPTLEILGIEFNDSHDFDDAPPGTCWVWGLAYTGKITAQVGDQADAVPITDDCYDLSDNYIEVVRDIPDGGTVAMPSGATIRYTCTQDGNADEVSFVAADVSNSRYAYIITSPSLEILGIEFNDSHDFDDAPPGTCWVWGLAYTGEITAEVGDQADEVELASDCADLSDNYITVHRDSLDGGMVHTDDDLTMINTVAGDGSADIIVFEHEDASNSKYAYVITNADNEILGLPEGDRQDFEGAGAGVCRVWGLAYTGMITAAIGDAIDSVALSDDCYDLSDNFIEVTRTSGEGLLNTRPAFTSDNLRTDGLEATVQNPVDGRILGTVKVDHDRQVNLGLHTYHGLPVRIESVRATSGVITIDWSASSLVKGMYVLTITDGQRVVTKKLVVL